MGEQPAALDDLVPSANTSTVRYGVASPPLIAASIPTTIIKITDEKYAWVEECEMRLFYTQEEADKAIHDAIVGLGFDPKYVR